MRILDGVVLFTSLKLFILVRLDEPRIEIHHCKFALLTFLGIEILIQTIIVKICSDTLHRIARSLGRPAHRIQWGPDLGRHHKLLDPFLINSDFSLSSFLILIEVFERCHDTGPVIGGQALDCFPNNAFFVLCFLPGHEVLFLLIDLMKAVRIAGLPEAERPPITDAGFFAGDVTL